MRVTHASFCICVEFGTFNRQDLHMVYSLFVNIRVILPKTLCLWKIHLCIDRNIQPNVAAGIVN